MITYPNVETIGFSGHRDTLTTTNFLTELNNTYPTARWIIGGAVGFDSQVEDFYREVRGHQPIIIVPDYKSYIPKVAPLKRNILIVNFSDLMVFLWDGRKKGGTYQTRRYTLEVGKPYIDATIASY